ncbi:MAG TPA: class I SAM-dependent methyltransferase [Gaiellaceae bacterium]|nr:class I SAM-dependent methyltransferase [Gaiellaceae bacterium]
MPRDDLPPWEGSWPQRRERRPRFTDPYYLHYSALARSLVEARDRHLRAPVAILDVGCGEMPYYPLFAAIAADYAGSDLTPGPRVRYVCPIESLTAPDAAFDLVLCTQVLEHVRDPARALGEIARVLRPGGHAFVTTHGVWPFHPYPEDLWRWTQQGLTALVERTPGVSLVEVVPHRATASSLALLLNYYVDIAARRPLLRPLGSAVTVALNAAALAGDRIPRLRYPHEDTLIHNFLLVVRRDGQPPRA